ncbi:PREDICTED: actin-binding protein IPP-like [Nicrophorus vespilloides]|uniref:Kelch-like protein diablo n=1 Tax=Nicrophorus vespilloides TaxID=110193 RepID=A0ABM1MRA6_NICVS|nr:PREDICTED: actin-binding protein IPP-like [Nicrophorus vespilloides]
MDFIIPTIKKLKNINTDNNNFIKPNEERTCSYSMKILKNLNNLRIDERFCDVEIQSQNRTFKVHKAILASSCPYFHAMFTGGLCEQNQHFVELPTIPAYILELVINFIYTGEANINQNNVQDLFVAADMLELHEVVLSCSEFLEKELHPINAIGIYRFAEAHNCKLLTNKSVQYIESHFVQVSEEKEIYELPKELLLKFLTSEYLCVDSEFQVFQVAIRWIMSDIVTRRRYVFEILKHIRLPLLSLGLLERSIPACNDSSLRVALRSVHDDLKNRKGCLVPLSVKPRLCAKKDIYMIGGSKRERYPTFRQRSELNYAAVEKFDVFKRAWSRAPDMSVNRIVPGVATLDGRIYAIGGEQETNSLSCGECFDPEENAWTMIANMSVPRCDFGLCSINGFLYALGGWMENDLLSTIERYDPKLDEWRSAGNLPHARFSMGVVSYEGLIYMVGGCSQHVRYLQDFLSYNPSTGVWRSLPQMTVARSQMGVAVLNDHLYVVGGDHKDQVLSSVEKYSFKKNKWTSIPKMNMARSRPAVAAVDGLLYVMGGYQNHDHFYRSQYTIAAMECYDPTTNQWTDCPDLPDSRAEGSAVIV